MNFLYNIRDHWKMTTCQQRPQLWGPESVVVNNSTKIQCRIVQSVSEALDKHIRRFEFCNWHKPHFCSIKDPARRVQWSQNWPQNKLLGIFPRLTWNPRYTLQTCSKTNLCTTTTLGTPGGRYLEVVISWGLIVNCKNGFSSFQIQVWRFSLIVRVTWGQFHQC